MGVFEKGILPKICGSGLSGAMADLPVDRAGGD